ncbi:GNAT family N-acetyltransferase [Rhizobium binxianense]
MSPPNADGLTFRQDYFGDPAAWNALVALLKDTFDLDVGPLQALGGPDLTSMPFGWFADDGTLAANLSAFAMPLVLNGRRINAAALQSGAVRPPWRGRGLYRDVTRKALAWCTEKGFEAIVLYTDKPALYEPYGFRTLPMHVYSGAAPAPVVSTIAQRRLDPGIPEDLALLRKALKSRMPVSQTLAVAESAAMFLINTRLDPDARLSWLEEKQAAVAWKMDGEQFILLDVVAPAIPSLADIIGGLGLQPASAEVLFRPDRLGWEGKARALEGGTRFMIRAADEITLEAPAMLSPMADF